MITGAKVKTDARDAFALAKLLNAGMIPKAYIYPKETRPTRDLLRRRAHLVNLRAEEDGSLRRLLLRYGILNHSRNDIKYVVRVRRSFDRHLKRHRGKARKLIACNIIAHKLAHAACQVLRDGRGYNEEMLFST